MENSSRSMFADFSEGATDGSYRKVVRDRGGVVEDATYEQRRDLSDVFYGVHETPRKQLGDGTSAVTPNYRPTSPWRLA